MKTRLKTPRSQHPSLNQEFQRLISLVCESIEEFRLYDQKKIAVSMGRSKGRGKTGIWAHVVPLRYTGGSRHRRGRIRGVSGFYSYKSPKILETFPEALYMVSFMLPRFFRLTPRERIETIVHELYHMHPTLRGDLRRFPKPHIHHGPTPAAYDRKVRLLTDEALNSMPELMKHPLIAADEEHFAKHRARRLPLPRRVFQIGDRAGEPPEPELPAATPSPGVRPAPAPEASGHVREFQLGFWLLFGAVLLGLLAATARAQSPGDTFKMLQSGPVYQSPSSGSDKLGELSAGDDVEFVRFSSSKKWAFVRGAKSRGWVPAESLKAAEGQDSSEALEAEETKTFGNSDIDEAAFDAAGVPRMIVNTGKKATSKESGESSLDPQTGESADSPMGSEAPKARRASRKSQVADRMSEFDRQFDKFYIKNKGRFFEKPTKFGTRYGILEPNDEVKLVSRSPGGQWLKVRLLLTGEEGWVPVPWVKLVRVPALKRIGANSLEIWGGFGNNGLKGGFGFGYLRNLLPYGFDSAPRDRAEIGLLFDYHLGEKVENSGSTLTTHFLVTSLVGRYVSSSTDGFRGGIAEAGLSVTNATVTTTGTSSDVLADAGVPSSGTHVGAHFGALGYFAPSEVIQFFGGVRLYLGSSASVVLLSGLALRF